MARVDLSGAIALFAVLLGCSAARSGPDTRGAAATPASMGAKDPAPASGAAVPPVSAAPVASERAESPTHCGATPCRLFSDERAAFAAVLEPAPAVLAVGESHAQRGSEAIEPSTRRFTRELLPMLAGHASDIVIELMLPNPRCAPESKKAQKEQKVVTEHQAKTDQNDYVALGTRAKELGIRPHALEPTCDDISNIAKAGTDVVTVSLDVVTRLSRETLSKLLAANAAAHDARMVVAYGGLMHNDLLPRPERARWSFGPVMKDETADRYTEIDLVVPEQIEDSPTWRSLPWVPTFDRDEHPAQAVLLLPSPRSYVLVFRRGAAGANGKTPEAAP